MNPPDTAGITAPAGLPLPPIDLLLVEDDEGLAELFRKALGPTGARCDWARTGQEAIAWLPEHPSCLLLLDYSLPDMTADGLLETIAQSGPVPPFIVTTGHGDERLAVSLMKLGARDYLVKDTMLLDRLPVVVGRVLHELRMQQQLEESERRLRQNERELLAIYDHTPTAMMLLDGELRLRKANAAIVEVFGRPVEQVLGLTLGEAFECQNRHQDPRGCGFGPNCPECPLQSCIRDTLHTGQPHRQVDGPLCSVKNGVAIQRDFLISTVCVDIEGQTYILVCLDNITQRKQAEQALRTSEERYRQLFNCVNDAVFAFHLQPDGKPSHFIEVNDVACRRLGYTRTELLQRSPADINSSGSTVLANAMHTLRQNREIVVETVHIAKDGRRIPVEINSHLFEFHGRQTVLALARDITERKHLETQVRQAQKMEAIGQLAGGIAHDFNNILAGLMLQFSLLRDEPGLPAKVDASLGELDAELKRAANLTRQLLLFSRRQVMETKPIDLNETLAALWNMLRRIIGEHINLRLTGATKELWIEGDANMLGQVILNLCVNARDAMPEGGTLTVDTRLVELSPDTAQDHPEARAGSFVCLSVSDTGCGMDARVLSHIFEPFFTTKPVGQGTGLGLSTVHGIVKQHHGWVQVESAVGQGSSFQVFFPSSPHVTTTAPAVEDAPVRGGNETILLVEDDALVRHGFAVTLRRLGYRVFEAAHGPAALQLWNQHRTKIDLVFTDMVMPEGMNGLQLVAKLRADQPALSVIIASGYSTELVEAQQAGGPPVTYLTKPFSAKKLVQVVRETLDQAAST
ncbi:MAG: response regulator [Opitutae bacterium]|nr:response regulator [Opitutae bacterium]